MQSNFICFLFIVVLLISQESDGQSSFDFDIDSTVYSLKFKRDDKNPLRLSVSLNLMYYGRNEMFMAVDDTNTDSFLTYFSDELVEEKYLSLYIGTCNEHRYPHYFCKKDSISLLHIKRLKPYSLSYKFNTTVDPLRYYPNYGIEFLFRTFRPGENVQTLKDENIKVSLEYFFANTLRTSLSIPPSIQRTTMYKKGLRKKKNI